MARLTADLIVVAVVFTLAACAHPFRQTVPLASGENVDVIGYHVVASKRLGEPADSAYVITYVTEHPLMRDKVREEADEVWAHFEPLMGSNVNHVIIQAVHEAPEGTGASVEFEFYKSYGTWSPPY